MTTPAVYRMGDVIGLRLSDNLSPNDARMLAAELLTAANAAEPDNEPGLDALMRVMGIFTPTTPTAEAGAFPLSYEQAGFVCVETGGKNPLRMSPGSARSLAAGLKWAADRAEPPTPPADSYQKIEDIYQRGFRHAAEISAAEGRHAPPPPLPHEPYYPTPSAPPAPVIRVRGWNVVTYGETITLEIIETESVVPPFPRAALLHMDESAARDIGRSLMKLAAEVAARPADIPSMAAVAVEIDTHPASPRPWSYDNQAAALPLVIGDSVILEAAEWLIEGDRDRAAIVVAAMTSAQVHTTINVGAALTRLALGRMPGR